MCADERRSGQRILRRLARSGCRGFLLPIDRLDQVREEAGGGGRRVSERQKREAPLGAAGLQGHSPSIGISTCEPIHRPHPQYSGRKEIFQCVALDDGMVMVGTEADSWDCISPCRRQRSPPTLQLLVAMRTARKTSPDRLSKWAAPRPRIRYECPWRSGLAEEKEAALARIFRGSQ